MQKVLVKTDKTSYLPGEEVTLDLDLTDIVAADEDWYASITVSDESSFMQLPKGSLMPSVSEMTYLEKEINGKPDQFNFSENYLDPLYYVG